MVFRLRKPGLIERTIGYRRFPVKRERKRQHNIYSLFAPRHVDIASSARSKAIEPFHNILFIFPLHQVVQLWVIGQDRLHVLDEASLYMPSAVDVQMEVNHGGLDVIMSQTIFYLGDVSAPVEQINGPRVTERMNRVDVDETLMGEGFGEILSAGTVYAVPGKFLSPLTDEDPVAEWGLRIAAVLFDIDLKKLCGFVLKIDKPEPISFSEDGQGFLSGIEVIKIKGGDLRCPGSRVEKEMEERVISESLFTSEVHRVKDLQDLIMVEKTYQSPLIALLRDVEDRICTFTVLGMHETDHFGKGFQGGKAMIPGSCEIFTLLLEVVEE